MQVLSEQLIAGAVSREHLQVVVHHLRIVPKVIHVTYFSGFRDRHREVALIFIEKDPAMLSLKKIFRQRVAPRLRQFFGTNE